MLSQSWEWAKIREQEWLQWYKLEPNARATDLRLQTQSVLHKLLNRADDQWTRPSRRHGRNRAPRPCLALFHLPDRPQPGPRTARPAARQPPRGGTSPRHLASSHSSLGILSVTCYLKATDPFPPGVSQFQSLDLNRAFRSPKETGPQHGHVDHWEPGGGCQQHRPAKWGQAKWKDVLKEESLRWAISTISKESTHSWYGQKKKNKTILNAGFIQCF